MLSLFSQENNSQTIGFHTKSSNAILVIYLHTVTTHFCTFHNPFIIFPWRFHCVGVFWSSHSLNDVLRLFLFREVLCFAFYFDIKCRLVRPIKWKLILRLAFRFSYGESWSNDFFFSTKFVYLRKSLKKLKLIFSSFIFSLFITMRFEVETDIMLELFRCIVKSHLQLFSTGSTCKIQEIFLWFMNSIASSWHLLIQTRSSLSWWLHKKGI